MAFLRTLIEGMRRGDAISTIDIADRRNGRRLAVICRVLAAAGIEHQAWLTPLRAMQLGDLEQRALSTSRTAIRFAMPHQVPLLITDRNESRIQAGKTLRISYDVKSATGRPLRPDEVFHPILFHPDQITPEAYDQASRLASRRSRPIRILFAGNCDPATYDRAPVRREYGLANRSELFRLAMELPPEMVAFPQTPEALESLLERGPDRQVRQLVWIDTNRFRIPSDKWFDLLSQADAFLCTPGVRYPWCQNLNEAMACGTVPLLEYPQLYNPALEPGRNALKLRDGEEFRADIEEVLSIGGDRMAEMSKAASAYHQHHLSLDRLADCLRRFANDRDAGTLTWYLAGKA